MCGLGFNVYAFIVEHKNQCKVLWENSMFSTNVYFYFVSHDNTQHDYNRLVINRRRNVNQTFLQAMKS